jgi:hypothetical protein
MLETRCCIAGGGPAGLMLGYLLARRSGIFCSLWRTREFVRSTSLSFRSQLARKPLDDRLQHCNARVALVLRFD